MQPLDDPGQRRFVSMPSLIAWTSLCILAAAWGRSLDESWQPVWVHVGAFGLIAAVGLGAVEQVRAVRRRRSRDEALQSRADFGLAQVNEEGATLDAIHCAVRILQATAENQSDCEHGLHEPAEDEEQTLARLSMKITPVVDNDDDCCELAKPVPGTLRSISSRRLTFRHAEPFVSRVAVLTFRLGDGQCLSFVVDVLWTEATPGGFVTGGAVLDVGVPADEALRDGSKVPVEICAV